MTDVEIAYNPDQVLNKLQVQRTKVDSFLDNTVTLLELMGDLAESLIGTEGDQQVEAAQTSAKTLLELEAEAKAYTAALEAVRNQYVPCERTTNFKKDLEQHAKRLVPTFRTKPEEHEAYQELCGKLGVEEDEEEDEEDGDDDDMRIRGDLNGMCPLSGRPRLEIEDPVEDQVGYVYEKASMLQYITENGGSVKCPAGASHMVKAADLKRASKLIREQRRHRQASQHGTQKQSQASEVVDVD